MRSPNLLLNLVATIVAGLFLFSCASNQIVLAPSRQAVKSSSAKAPNKANAPAKSDETSKSVLQNNSQSSATSETSPSESKPAVKSSSGSSEVKIKPVVQSPKLLLENVGNPTAANDVIENKLNLNELEAAAADPNLINFKPQLLLKIGKVYLRKKEPERASEYLRSVSFLYPQSVYASQASVMLAALQANNIAESNVIGAILPLSGRNASVGQHALNAIRLGLGLNKGEKNFRLALFDSQSEPEMAAKGVDKLVNEDKAVAVIGGFTSREAYSIAARAELLSVPFIGFSQKPDLTSVGDYVFRNALTPEMQVNTLVDFAFEKLGAKRFGILYPNDSYGVEFSNTFWDHVLARGGQVTAAQTYDPKSTDFSDVTQKLVGLYYPEARAEELKQRLKEIKLAKKQAAQKKDPSLISPNTKSTRDNYSDAQVLPPVVNFDVLFVPDTSRALGQVIAFMKFYEVENMNYLGTNLWNSADLPKRAVIEDGAIYFVDAIDHTESAHRQTEFFKEYTAEFNEEPTLVEIQAYEAARILKDLVVGGANSRESLAFGLRNLGKTTVGVTGELNMSPQRDILRPIHVMMLDSGLVKKIQPD
jgi:branched-chain amino acid transport system substrate-binding protein